jgi:hypothetical protein
MVMALITWILMKMGMAPGPEDFLRMAREFRERGHHLTIDFGGQRDGWTRWGDDEETWIKHAIVGLGYDYYVDRRYHGVGFEALVQSLGPILRPDHGPNAIFVGGGVAYYPVRPFRLFMQAGPQIHFNGEVDVAGRVGAGFRFMFFKLGMQPYFYVQQTTKGQHGFALGFRFEY